MSDCLVVCRVPVKGCKVKWTRRNRTSNTWLLCMRPRLNERRLLKPLRWRPLYLPRTPHADSPILYLPHTHTLTHSHTFTSLHLYLLLWLIKGTQDQDFMPILWFSLMRILWFSLSLTCTSTMPLYNHTHTHSHTLLITCTCCYDETKGTQDQDFSCSFSDSPSHAPALPVSRSLSFSLPPSLTHALTLTITCTCCYDAISGIQDLFWCRFSMILSDTSPDVPYHHLPSLSTITVVRFSLQRACCILIAWSLGVSGEGRRVGVGRIRRTWFRSGIGSCKAWDGYECSMIHSKDGMIARRYILHHVLRHKFQINSSFNQCLTNCIAS